jgi:hypothetical protein
LQNVLAACLPRAELSFAFLQFILNLKLMTPLVLSHKKGDSLVFCLEGIEMGDLELGEKQGSAYPLGQKQQSPMTLTFGEDPSFVAFLGTEKGSLSG